jgi:cold shock CspA family protein
MTKAMMFIDGSWLYSNTPKLEEADGDSDFRIDFGKLPNVLVESLQQRSNINNLDLVRTFFFSSYATNYDSSDEEAVQKRLNFFSMLREKYQYDVKVYPVDFRGRPLRKEDRDPDDWFEPQEKCVDISFASTLLYNAAIPDAFDVAICLLGEREFEPVLKNLRQLGKRVAIASIKDGCDEELTDRSDDENIRDFDMIWLDDLLDDIKLVYEEHQLVCESPMHEGDREVWTTYHPRDGENFYCDECREKYKRQKENNYSDGHQDTGEDRTGRGDDHSSGPSRDGSSRQTEQMTGSGTDQNASPAQETVGNKTNGDQVRELNGFVKKKFPDRGYGFIKAEDGQDYFFHLSDLMFDLTFDDVTEGKDVEFMVKKEASPEEAGAATNVRFNRM